jgi:hypothetical protein
MLSNLPHSNINEWAKIVPFKLQECSVPYKKWQEVTKMTEQIAGQFANRTEKPFPLMIGAVSMRMIA